MRKQFLYLKQLMNHTEVPATPSPSRLIEKVWHVHMMRQIMYRKFCQKNFGKIIDHDIGGQNSEIERYKSLRRTMSQLKLAFNEEPDKLIWEDDT